MIRRDITDVLPAIRRTAMEWLKYESGFSRNKLRKLGVLPNPWKGKGRWKPAGRRK